MNKLYFTKTLFLTQSNEINNNDGLRNIDVGLLKGP